MTTFCRQRVRKFYVHLLFAFSYIVIVENLANVYKIIIVFFYYNIIIFKMNKNANLLGLPIPMQSLQGQLAGACYSLFCFFAWNSLLDMLKYIVQRE